MQFTTMSIWPSQWLPGRDWMTTMSRVVEGQMTALKRWHCGERNPAAEWFTQVELAQVKGEWGAVGGEGVGC